MNLFKEYLSCLCKFYGNLFGSPDWDKRMSYSPQAVANWFIGKAKKEGVPIDQLKLMKLVYIAQGVALLNNIELVNEPLLAWKYGPVFRSLYYSFSGRGMKPITEYAISSRPEVVFSDNPMPDFIDPTDSEAAKILEDVWGAFSHASGIKLSNWSHNPDGPWYKAKAEGLEVIPNGYVKDCFQNIIKKKL